MALIEVSYGVQFSSGRYLRTDPVQMDEASYQMQVASLASALKEENHIFHLTVNEELILVQGNKLDYLAAHAEYSDGGEPDGEIDS